MTTEPIIDETHVDELDVADTISHNPVLRAPTATLAGLVTFLIAVATVAGQDITWLHATAAVLVPSGIISAVWPRWATSRGIYWRHPALFTGAVGTLLALGGQLVGIEALDSQASVILVGGVMAIVGFLYPRDGRPDWLIALAEDPDFDDDLEDLDRERVGE